MTLTYTWEFPALDCYPTHEGKENVVFTVHWRLQGEDAEGNTGHTFSTVGLTVDPDAEFIPFESLTKEIVQGWVETSLQNQPTPMGDITVLDAIKASIEAQIQEKLTPSRITKSAPWVTPITPAI
jgi:hypothetical protein